MDASPNSFDLFTPDSTSTSVIPLFFDSTNTTKGLFDFGLFQCSNSTCSDGSRATSINDSNNAPIAFWVKMANDATTDGSTSPGNDVDSSIGTTPFTIRVSGQWNFD